MQLKIEPGTPADIDELERLYDELNDHLASNGNFPGWIKGIYPCRDNAQAGVQDRTLFVARCGGKIAGSFILDHCPEEAYHSVKWKIEADYRYILVVHTLVVHPAFLRMGVGCALMNHALQLARETGMKAIRLDVYVKNFPAIAMYERCGFAYIDTADLGYGQYGLDWFELYEKAV